jgi:hypothetical protein
MLKKGNLPQERAEVGARNFPNVFTKHKYERAGQFLGRRKCT